MLHNLSFHNAIIGKFLPIVKHFNCKIGRKLPKMLREARESKNLTQVDLAEKLDIDVKTLRKYEQDENSVQLGVLKKIYAALDMEFSSNPQKSFQQCSSNQKKIQKNVPAMFQQSEKLSVSQEKLSVSQEKGDIVTIPFYQDVLVSAGAGAVNDNESYTIITLGKDFLHHYYGITSYHNLEIVPQKGDSMQPALPDRSCLLVQRVEPRDGQICVARVDGEIYTKRIQKRPRLRLISENPIYEPIDITEGMDFEIIGVVVGYFSKS
jgi:phage repressor protein C with HTH and peptisase S24 domain